MFLVSFLGFHFMAIELCALRSFVCLLLRSSQAIFQKACHPHSQMEKEVSSNLMNLHCWQSSSICNHRISFIFLPRNKLFDGCVLEGAKTDHLSLIKTDLAQLLSSLQQKRFLSSIFLNWVITSKRRQIYEILFLPFNKSAN